LAAVGSWRPLLSAAAGAVLVMGVGGALTDIGPWYAGLRKPSWQPPDWLFGPAWTAISALVVIAAARSWNLAPSQSARARVVTLFLVNGALNVLWNILFFTLRRPDWALVEVVALWLSVAALVWVTRPICRSASWLLVPYLVWVAFAGFLNLAIVRLNAPF
jgi:tryptophan-rich sensory protein